MHFVNRFDRGFNADFLFVVRARIGVAFSEFKQAAAAEIPVARVGTPEDIAHAVSFFVGEAASFVSGQVLYVAGGPKS